MKKILKPFVYFMLGLLFASSTTSLADTIEKINASFEKEIKIFDNGYELNLNSYPVNINGSIYLPLRDVAESFGKEVSYDFNEKIITLRDKHLIPENEINYQGTFYKYRDVYVAKSLELMSTIGEVFDGHIDVKNGKIIFVFKSDRYPIDEHREYFYYDKENDEYYVNELILLKYFEKSFLDEFEKYQFDKDKYDMVLQH